MAGDAHTAKGGKRLARLALSLTLIALGIALAPEAAASPGWDVILDRPTPDFRDIEFASENEGWLASGSGLLHSIDGGETWEEAAEISVLNVDFTDPQHGWAAGYSGAVYHTSGGGQSWEEQDSGTNVHLRDVEAISADEAWIVGSGEGFSDAISLPFPTALLHTMDGGDTWERIETPEDTWFDEIEFVGQRGWALGQCSGSGPPGCGEELPIGGPTGILLFTDDGGETWVPLENSVPPVARAMTFVSPDEGWLLADDCDGECSPAVFHTIDGGATWQLQFDASAFVAMEDLVFEDPERGWALARDCYDDGCPWTLLATSDGGDSWDQFDVGAAEGSQARIQATDAAIYVISQGGFSEPGSALRSTDGGATWQPMEHPAISLLHLAFGDTETGYAVASGHIVRTDDAGRTWRTVADVPADVSALEFMTSTHGIATSRFCCEPSLSLLVFRTEDGGEAWRQVAETTSADGNTFVHDIEFADDNRGWIALDGRPLFTEDGGQTWREAPLPDSSTDLIDADLADGDTAWAILPPQSFGGTVNRLARTDDAGRTWRVVMDAPDRAAQVEFVDAQHGWIVMHQECSETGCLPELLLTTDGGLTWQDVKLDEDVRIADLVFVDPLNGWAVAESCDDSGCAGRILHSADGGLTWTTQLAGADHSGRLEFADVETGWFNVIPSSFFGIGAVAPNRTVLYHTTDAGGGPVGSEPTPGPTPTIELPDVGTGPSERGDGVLPLALIVFAVAGSIATAAVGLRRARR